jgi:hypothetical protein
MLIHCILASNPANAHNTGRARKSEKKNMSRRKETIQAPEHHAKLENEKTRKTVRPTIKCR